jgi:two-component system, chemotaxis family, protein-glutamate methylesterase/glutaminase
MAEKFIKVLIVDDSTFIRHTVSKHLQADPKIEVVGQARNGVEALAMIPDLKPDVIILDVEMPQMDGMTALKHIMSSFPTPVIMLSALTKRGTSTTIRALMRGAVDFVPKPDATTDIHTIIAELIPKIKAVSATQKVYPAVQTSPLTDLDKAHSRPFSLGDKLIIIGASTGGPRALRQVITSLPSDLAAAVLVVQQMPIGYTQTLAQRLNELSFMTVQEATEGERIAAGLVLVAAGGFHLRVNKRRVFLDDGPPRNHVSTAVDVTMETAVPYFGSNIIGVILTGMGKDGTAGAAVIKEAGGYIIAEHQSTSVVYGMPGSVVRAGLADRTIPLPQIAPLLTELVYG